MTSPIEYGYLERPYLGDPYLTGFVIDHLGSQVTLVIQSSEASGTQVSRTIQALDPLGSQVDREVQTLNSQGAQVDLKITNLSFLGSQVSRTISALSSMGSQVDRETQTLNSLGSQVDLEITSDKVAGAQVSRKISALSLLGSQVDREIRDLEPMGSQVRRENYISHWLCPSAGYLVRPYLENPYLGAVFCAHVGEEVERKIKFLQPLGSQVDREITAKKNLGAQVERVIEDFYFLGSQVELVNAVFLASQVRVVLYNNKKIRILCEFPSRGTAGAGNNAWGQPKGAGLNWLASNTAAGDFGVNNLNTDIVEQVWRTNGGVLTGNIACDTELNQGIAPDTLAILNHNWTSSAVVLFEGSNDSAFSSIGATIPITASAINAYYIAPTLPTAQFRYWRINISDTTNPAGFLQVGTVVFGSAIIFQGEDIIDSVRRRSKHFSDKVSTEGFTNVANDRALKRAVTVSFSRLDYKKGNFANLTGVFETARTSLKCLWVPDPLDPTRFTVFGKIAEIPEEEHLNYGNAADTVSLTVEVDESL